MRPTLLAALAWLALAGPAAASTLAPLDLAPGQTAVGLGLFPTYGTAVMDFSFDRGIAPRLSVGAVLLRVQNFVGEPKTMAAARLAWMPEDHAGMLVSLGGGSSVWGAGVAEGFLQVAGALRAAWGPLTLRLTAGPALIFMARLEPLQSSGPVYWDPTPGMGEGRLSIMPLSLNAELGWRLAENHELVLGGYSVFGYRARF